MRWKNFLFAARLCCSPTLLLLLSIAMRMEWKVGKRRRWGSWHSSLFSSFSSPSWNIVIKKALSASARRECSVTGGFDVAYVRVHPVFVFTTHSLIQLRFSLRKSHKIQAHTPSTSTYIGWMDLFFFFFFLLSTLEFQHKILYFCCLRNDFFHSGKKKCFSTLLDGFFRLLLSHPLSRHSAAAALGIKKSWNCTVQ